MPVALIRLFAALALAFGGCLPLAAPAASKVVDPVPLDGQRSDIAAAAANHCHDRIPTALRCFRSATERDSDALSAAPEATGVSQSTDVGTLSSGYVIAWEFTGYAGSSVLLSKSYANLGTIGWNDRISSYKVYTTLTGYFYEHANYAGLTQSFCCNTQVSNVGSLYNNKFSSFYLP